MNLLGLVPKLSATDKEVIAWSVRNVRIGDTPNSKLRHFPSYFEAARSQELYFLDAEDVLVRVRKSSTENRQLGYVTLYTNGVGLIKKLEDYIKTSKETGG